MSIEMDDYRRHSARIVRELQPERQGVYRWRLECSCGFRGPDRISVRQAERDLDVHLAASA